MYAQTRIPTTSKCSAYIIPTSQDVMKRELIDIRPDEAPSGCLRRGLAPATSALLFHLTCETTRQYVRPRHQIADRESMPIWYAPVVIPKRANTYLAGSRTYPSTSLTGDTRCWSNQSISPIAYNRKARRHVPPPS